MLEVSLTLTRILTPNPNSMEYVVDRIVDHRCVKRLRTGCDGKTRMRDVNEYRVRWEHHDPIADTWEPESELCVDGTDELIDCLSEYLQLLDGEEGDI